MALGTVNVGSVKKKTFTNKFLPTLQEATDIFVTESNIFAFFGTNRIIKLDHELNIILEKTPSQSSSGYKVAHDSVNKRFAVYDGDSALSSGSSVGWYDYDLNHLGTSMGSLDLTKKGTIIIDQVTGEYYKTYMTSTTVTTGKNITLEKYSPTLELIKKTTLTLDSDVKNGVPANKMALSKNYLYLSTKCISKSSLALVGTVASGTYCFGIGKADYVLFQSGADSSGKVYKVIGTEVVDLQGRGVLPIYPVQNGSFLVGANANVSNSAFGFWNYDNPQNTDITTCLLLPVYSNNYCKMAVDNTGSFLVQANNKSNNTSTNLSFQVMLTKILI